MKHGQIGEELVSCFGSSTSSLHRSKGNPRRQAYNSQEAGLNKRNYDAVVARQGPDELLTRICGINLNKLY
jgi:hypothetical protein